MRNWNNEAKKELIIRFTSSINDKPTDKYDFSTFFWCMGGRKKRRGDHPMKLRSDHVNLILGSIKNHFGEHLKDFNAKN